MTPSLCWNFSRFTAWQAFKDVLKEIGDLAGQREIVSENLQAHVLTKISLLSKELRDDRKVCLKFLNCTNKSTNQNTNN